MFGGSIYGGDLFLIAGSKSACFGVKKGGRGGGYVGFMLVIFSPSLDFTNSLLMKRPRGCLYSWPLGALRSTNSSDILLTWSVLEDREAQRHSEK